MSRAVEEPVQQGRDALRRHAWREAFEFLSQADRERLSAEDLEGLAEAAWWLGRLDVCIDARERAYAAFTEGGDRRGGARMALALAHDHQLKGVGAVGAGWLSRAQRLLEDQPECPEKGYLARVHGTSALSRGEFDHALEHAGRTLEIGERLGNRNLQALALHDQGRVLVAKGQVEEGLALVDEAMAAAVGGELGPYTTGVIYCNAINLCESLADYERAGDWTDAAKRWCDRQAISGFPGVCRVRRAQIIRLRGAWSEAEQEARRAYEELRGFWVEVAGEAFYEVGEIRLRMGDLPAAEEAFRQAHEMGRDPQPGLALLRLTEGNVESAEALIARALADESWNRLARARLLPARVRVAVATGDLDVARSAAEELEAIHEEYGSRALGAVAACARGLVQTAEGDPSSGARSLQHGWRLWREVDAPYEAAEARMLLGEAYRAAGDEEAAALEVEAARQVFERLGAATDARRASELLGGAAPRGPAPGGRATRTFMFTDVVRSTNLVEAIGDDAWADLVRWHDRTLRSLFAGHEGEEIDHAGDGFFVAFGGPAAAIECAVAIQRSLAEHRRAHGFAPQVRIGLHTTEATRQGREYRGRGVHQAARIAAVAEGGQIVASRETADWSGQRFPTSEPRPVSLKGISEPVEVLTIEWG